MDCFIRIHSLGQGLTRQCFVVTCKKWRRTAVPRQDKVTVWGFFMIYSFVPIFPDTIVANVHHTHRALCLTSCKTSWSLQTSSVAVDGGDQVSSLETEHLDDPATFLHPGSQHMVAHHLQAAVTSTLASTDLTEEVPRCREYDDPGVCHQDLASWSNTHPTELFKLARASTGVYTAGKNLTLPPAVTA